MAYGATGRDGVRRPARDRSRSGSFFVTARGRPREPRTLSATAELVTRVVVPSRPALLRLPEDQAQADVRLAARRCRRRLPRRRRCRPATYASFWARPRPSLCRAKKAEALVEGRPIDAGVSPRQRARPRSKPPPPRPQRATSSPSSRRSSAGRSWAQRASPTAPKGHPAHERHTFTDVGPDPSGRCRHLRTKMMSVVVEWDEHAAEYPSTSAAYWCLMTMGTGGPDDGPARPSTTAGQAAPASSLSPDPAGRAESAAGCSSPPSSSPPAPRHGSARRSFWRSGRRADPERGSGDENLLLGGIRTRFSSCCLRARGEGLDLLRGSRSKTLKPVGEPVRASRIQGGRTGCSRR